MVPLLLPAEIGFCSPMQLAKDTVILSSPQFLQPKSLARHREAG